MLVEVAVQIYVEKRRVLHALLTRLKVAIFELLRGERIVGSVGASRLSI